MKQLNCILLDSLSQLRDKDISVIEQISTESVISQLQNLHNKVCWACPRYWKPDQTKNLDVAICLCQHLTYDIPENCKIEVIKRCHEHPLNKHKGIVETIERLKKIMIFPKFIKQVVIVNTRDV